MAFALDFWLGISEKLGDKKNKAYAGIERCWLDQLGILWWL